MIRYLLILSFACCSVPFSATASCLHYDGEPVTLNGRLTLQTFYGPPNYGENPNTDSRETQGILALAQPICVDPGVGINDTKETNQVEVTLVPPSGVNFKDYAEKQVAVTGTLFHSFTGHHHTAVLMGVSRIEVTSEVPNSDLMQRGKQLRAAVDQAYKTMSKAGLSGAHGNDFSSFISSYFPNGMSFADAEDILRYAAFAIELPSQLNNYDVVGALHQYSTGHIFDICRTDIEISLSPVDQYNYSNVKEATGKIWITCP